MHPALRRLSALTVLAAVTQVHAAGALSISREVTLDSPPDTVWKLVGGFNALDVWHPAVKHSSVKGGANQVGAVRTLDLGGGATITEKLTAYKATPGASSYSYDILTSPLPVQHYRSTIAVSAAADGKTLIKWSSTFDSKDAPDAKAIEVVQGIYDAGLDRVTATLKK